MSKMNEFNERVYVVDSDNRVIDAFDSLDDYEDAMWLCQAVAEWFADHEQANEDFARFAEIDDRWVVSKFA